MSGRCNSCTQAFGVFRKEHGCKQCGFTFCSKCLTQKIAIPKRNNEVHHVCAKCYNILSGKIKENLNPGRYSPPEAYKKRIAALETPDAPKPRPQRDTHSSKMLYKGLGKEDRQIAERLEKLKEKPKAPSEKEMAERLAKLRGQDPAKVTATQQKFYHPPDRRTQQEQMNDLLDEICAEIEIDSHYPSPQQEVEQRLTQLKQKGKSRENDESTANLNKAKDINDLNKDDVSVSKTYSDKVINIPPDQRSVASSNSNNLDVDGKEVEELADVNRLIAQSAVELELDAKKAIADLEQDKEIQQRLAQLKTDRQKNKELKDNPATEDVEDEDEETEEEEAMKKIIKQALEESKLDESLEASGIDVSKSKLGKGNDDEKQTYKDFDDDDDDVDDDDELPWCCICNANAAVRCVDCDRDLYCNACFKQGHESFDMKNHETRKFKRKSKHKEDSD